MGRKSTIPGDVLRYKPCPCCRIRNDKGVYWVYKYGSVKLKSGKWSNDWGYLIGKIIPGEGFSPNKRYMEELEGQSRPAFVDGITDVAYGEYSLLVSLSGGILANLEGCFPPGKAAQIYAYALIICAKGYVRVGRVDDYYQESILSVMYGDYPLEMGRDGLHALLRELGMNAALTRNFEKSLAGDASKSVALGRRDAKPCFAGSMLAWIGDEIDSAESQKAGVLAAYDLGKMRPLTLRTFRDPDTEKMDIFELLGDWNLDGPATLIACGECFTEPVLKYIAENGLRYITPVPPSEETIRHAVECIGQASGEFEYGADGLERRRVNYYEEKTEDAPRLIVFRDERESESIRETYKRLMDAEEVDCAEDEYDRICDWSGVYVIQTNLDGPAESVYSGYKSALAAGVFNGCAGDDSRFEDPDIRDYYAERGLDLVALVSELIRAELEDAIRQAGITGLSASDVLLMAGRMRMVCGERGRWKLNNAGKINLEVLEKIGFVPEAVYTPAT